MKNGYILVLMMVFSLAFTSCEKNDPECKLVGAKIIRYDCDRVIFQLLTDEAIGDANWEDKQTGLRYNNVVSYYNTCKIAEIAKGELITIYVEPVVSNQTTSIFCYQCLAVSQDPPYTKVELTAISKNPCETN